MHILGSLLLFQFFLLSLGSPRIDDSDLFASNSVLGGNVENNSMSQDTMKEILKTEVSRLSVDVALLSVYDQIWDHFPILTDEDIQMKEEWQKLLERKNLLEEERQKIRRSVGKDESKTTDAVSKTLEAVNGILEEEKKKLLEEFKKISEFLTTKRRSILEENKKNLQMAKRLLKEQKMLYSIKKLIADYKTLLRDRIELETEKKKLRVEKQQLRELKKKSFDEDKNRTSDVPIGEDINLDELVKFLPHSLIQKQENLLEHVRKIGRLLEKRKDRIRYLEEKSEDFPATEDENTPERNAEKEGLQKKLEKEKNIVNEAESKLKTLKNELLAAIYIQRK